MAVIFVNANVVTLDPTQPVAAALRVAGDRITHVWTGAPPASVSGKTIDLAGATVLPGLVDAHLHLQSLGEAAREIDLVGAPSLAATLARVQGGATHAAANRWLRGRGWDQNDWPTPRFPTAADLDRVVADRPVWLERIDGHAAWVNSRALALAGIDRKTKSPPGGEIVAGADGAPTGILIDNAMDLVTAVQPQATGAELRADLAAALRKCAAVGLTGVHDMGTTPAMLAELEALAVADALPVRVTAYLSGTDAELAPLLQEPPRRQGLLRVVGVKLFADGALGSRGAALLAPYSDAPQSPGLLLTPPAVLAQRSRRVAAAGYQVAVHAIGDRGVRVALDALAAIGNGGGVRHRIEHAQVISPPDFDRFAALEIIASMQPTHATSDMPWAEARLGAERLRGAYAWRQLADRGVTLAFGSDAPVEDVSPWLGLYAAVTRQDLKGEPKEGFMPGERLPIGAALVAYTGGAAAAAMDSDLGRIAPGAKADLTVVDRDPRSVAATELATTRVLRTIVDGRER
ncbi:MAG: amidohydrolase [Deltaproteobacteria bacterium]|nr:amidohydrolase [Deltaproteobacteria bacterium]